MTPRFIMLSVILSFHNDNWIYCGIICNKRYSGFPKVHCDHVLLYRLYRDNGDKPSFSRDPAIIYILSKSEVDDHRGLWPWFTAVVVFQSIGTSGQCVMMIITKYWSFLSTIFVFLFAYNNVMTNPFLSPWLFSDKNIFNFNSTIEYVFQTLYRYKL